MGKKVDLWLITVTILRDDNAWCPSGNSFYIPEPDTVLCFHLCPSLLAYHVSVQLACVSLGTLALGHISPEDLGHPESSMPNPFLHISRDTASYMGPGFPLTCHCIPIALGPDPHTPVFILP